MKVKSLSRVQLLATSWTAAYQAPPSMGFSRQVCWNVLPLPSPIIYATYKLFVIFQLNDSKTAGQVSQTYQTTVCWGGVGGVCVCVYCIRSDVVKVKVFVAQ